jgi:hypothetical protein
MQVMGIVKIIMTALPILLKAIDDKKGIENLKKENASLKSKVFLLSIACVIFFLGFVITLFLLLK